MTFVEAQLESRFGPKDVACKCVTGGMFRFTDTDYIVCD